MLTTDRHEASRGLFVTAELLNSVGHTKRYGSIPTGTSNAGQVGMQKLRFSTNI